MKKLLRDILVIGWLNGWVPLLRGWVWLLANVITPITFLIILWIYGGETGLKWGLLGGLIWTVASNGISLIGDATFYRIEIKFQQMLVAAPVSPVAYALGLALSSFIFAAPAVAFFTGFLALLGVLTPAALGISAVVLALLWISTAGLGFVASTFINQMRYAWAVPGIMSAVLSSLAPVYWPASILPVEYLGSLLPTGAAGILCQSALGLAEYPPSLLASAWISLFAYSIVSLLLTAKVARWRER